MNFDQSQPRPLPAAEAAAALRRLLAWQGRGNLYALDQAFLRFSVQWKELESATPVKSLADWKQFWGGAEVDSLEGRVRYQGGDLLTKLRAMPEQLTPDDFRLRPDSAGYRAGKDGKDLGADVDLVGPGQAYERWKKTPEYQQWLKETKQVTKAEAPKTESKAFVLLGGKGAAERRFDTLAEAVLGVDDGDTIEIRGNGPFVTEPINIGNLALSIRAGKGCRPVIRLAPQSAQTFEALLRTNGPLVLEGIEFQRLGQKQYTARHALGPQPCIVWSEGTSLHVANCRFRVEGSTHQICIWFIAPVCVVRNCEFMSPGSFSLSGNLPPCEVRVMENCLHVGGWAQGVIYQREYEAQIRLTRNTLVSSDPPILLHEQTAKPLEKDEVLRAIRLEASDNVFDCPSVLRFAQSSALLGKLKPREPAEATPLLQRLLKWRDRSNVYVPGSASLSLFHDRHEPYGPRTLVDWSRFWGQTGVDALEGRVRYQGGNLLAKLRTAPEQVTPEDFRLRPDSAGYRAGKDGKDLGADVDLVGPGAAYERWKRTPEYQPWLKDSGQMKK